MSQWGFWFHSFGLFWDFRIVDNGHFTISFGPNPSSKFASCLLFSYYDYDLLNRSSWPGDWQLLGVRGILDSWPLGHHSLRRWVRRGNGGGTAQLQPWLLAAVLRHLEVHDHDRLKEMCGHDERTVSRETWSIYLMFLYLNGQILGGVPPRIHGSSLPSNCGIPWGWLGASSIQASTSPAQKGRARNVERKPWPMAQLCLRTNRE